MRVVYENLITQQQTLLALNAGVVAVTQDSDGALRPIVDCHLTPSGPELGDVLDRVAREGRMGGPAEHLPWIDSADLNALYGRFASGTLFDGAWQLRGFLDLAVLGGDFNGDWWASPIFDLADGRSVSVVGELGGERRYWFVAGWQGKQMADDPAEVRVYATSLAVLLEGALDNGGDITQLDSGSLADYLEM